MREEEEEGKAVVVVVGGAALLAALLQRTKTNDKKKKKVKNSRRDSSGRCFSRRFRPSTSTRVRARSGRRKPYCVVVKNNCRRGTTLFGEKFRSIKI